MEYEVNQVTGKSILNKKILIVFTQIIEIEIVLIFCIRLSWWWSRFKENARETRDREKFQCIFGLNPKLEDQVTQTRVLRSCYVYYKIARNSKSCRDDDQRRRRQLRTTCIEASSTRVEYFNFVFFFWRRRRRLSVLSQFSISMA